MLHAIYQILRAENDLMLLKQPEASFVLGIKQRLPAQVMLEEEFSPWDNLYILLCLLVAHRMLQVTQDGRIFTI